MRPLFHRTKSYQARQSHKTIFHKKIPPSLSPNRFKISLARTMIQFASSIYLLYPSILIPPYFHSKPPNGPLLENALVALFCAGSLAPPAPPANGFP
mmetsp:Transcript_10554/g.15814  ORF Transcript_10554/g.15814 Transcript_10554/m.15814 type:complete len:97 (+) Transcript_10554:200-490(+)